MAENEYDYLEDALPGFSKARLIVKAAEDSIRPLGFKGSKFDFYRFANRFRLATSFRGLNLAGFEEETTDGYGALTRVFFSCSAFEGYTELADDQAPPYRTLLPITLVTISVNWRGSVGNRIRRINSEST